jgi:hypothetical protein
MRAHLTRTRLATRLGLAALGVLLVSRCAVAAEYQIRPFFGATLGGATTFIDLEKAAGKPGIALGVTAVRLGEVIGVDLDFADAPGFFESGDQRLVLGSRVTMFTGNLVVAVPRRLTEYSLRPYVVGGAGLMRVSMRDYFDALTVTDVVPAFDVGAGVIGFLTNRVGVAWELRRFQSIGGKSLDRGLTFGGEQLSFWRASMALAIRY